MPTLEQLERLYPSLAIALLMVGPFVIIGSVTNALWFWDNPWHRLLVKIHGKTFSRIIFFIIGVAMVGGGIFLLIREYLK
jgi:hypothetical protein